MVVWHELYARLSGALPLVAQCPQLPRLGTFLIGYGFFRIFVDFFREYRVDFFGLPPGQAFNIGMTAVSEDFYDLVSPFEHCPSAPERKAVNWVRRQPFRR